ncbi:MAG: glycerophosphodiester phosphodiesterase [Arenicellales bacterium]
MTVDAIEVWRDILFRLRLIWRPVLAVNLACAALGFVLLAPFTGMITSLLIRLSGQSALADLEIARALLSPLGILSLIIVLTVVLTIGILGQASMMYLGVRAKSDRGSTIRSLGFAGSNIRSILAFSLRLVTRLLLIIFPFLAVGLGIAWVLITEYDINYYLNERPPEFWIAAAAIACIALAMCTLLLRKLLAWTATLPLLLFAGVSPADCFGQSERRTQNKLSKILVILAVWAFITLVLGAIPLILVNYLGDWIVPGFIENVNALVVLLGGLAALWASLGFLGASFSAATSALALTEVSKRLGVSLDTVESLATDLSESSPGRIKTIARLLIILSVGVVVAAISGAWFINNIKLSDNITIAAHRGASGTAPENTLAAVNQAIEDRADWIEIDVQETADGEVVVIHDSDFMKLAGIDLKVWDGAFEEIRNIDVGSWFDPRFDDQRVPTLAEVLKASRGKARVLIELKYYGHAQQLEQRVIDIVEATEMTPNVAIMSLEYSGILKIRALRPDWTVGLLSATAIGDLTQFDTDFLAASKGMVTPNFVRGAHDAGKEVFVWTINDPISLFRMLVYGVDGVITDEPEMIRRTMTALSTLSTTQQLLVFSSIFFRNEIPERIYRDNSP